MVFTADNCAFTVPAAFAASTPILLQAHRIIFYIVLFSNKLYYMGSKTAPKHGALYESQPYLKILVEKVVY